jgi:hypothetical protein
MTKDIPSQAYFRHLINSYYEYRGCVMGAYMLKMNVNGL